MDWQNYLYPENEKPLDRLVEGYSNTSIFRKIAFVGDSLSSGEFETVNEKGEAEYHDMYEYSFGQYIARKNGLTAYNFSRGGLTAATYMKDYEEGYFYWDPQYASQAYVMALGVNDLCYGGFETGTVEDIDLKDPSKNKPTFAGNYAAIVQRYKEIAPDAKFFFVTFAKTSNKLFASKAKEHRKLLYELAELFDNCYVIDLYEFGPVHDDKFCENYFMYGHMNPMGYLFTAKIIDSYIDYIVRTNPNDFKTAGFINTNIKY
ncbi:MAG: SGNH/GDSL hydrolase family protein [Clostridia bacterium]|nr:SGNH/GDSL hydrolase family protein [Clostridia bacterium]